MRVPARHLFHPDRRDVLAAGNHDVFHPVADLDVAVGMDRRKGTAPVIGTPWCT
jgi:hypothetical protein